MATASADEVLIVKHVPHEFQWKKLDPTMEVTEKKKKTERKF